MKPIGKNKEFEIDFWLLVRNPGATTGHALYVCFRIKEYFTRDFSIPFFGNLTDNSWIVRKFNLRRMY